MADEHASKNGALHGLEPVGKPGAELAAHPRKQQEEYGRVIREADTQKAMIAAKGLIGQLESGFA